ncbi:hypothetical protein DIBJMFBN_02665 [Mannheimia haemolytica]
MKAKGKLVAVSELMEEDDHDLADKLFNENGGWDKDAYQSNEWKNTESHTYSAQFWQVFEFCLNNLPANQARVFMMRSHLEWKPKKFAQNVRFHQQMCIPYCIGQDCSYRSV